MWVLTVLTDTYSSWAISRCDSVVASSRSTTSSRSVSSPAGPGAVRRPPAGRGRPPGPLQAGGEHPRVREPRDQPPCLLGRGPGAVAVAAGLADLGQGQQRFGVLDLEAVDVQQRQHLL